MDMDDKELFEAATTDEPATEVTTEPTVETPAVETTESGQPRDEHGRFAKVEGESPEPAATAQPTEPPPPQGQAQSEANVPSWRLREEREAREAAEMRANEAAAFIRQMQAQSRPAEQPAVDPFENPQEFRDFGVRQAVDPIRQELAQTREYYSRRDAIREHGEDTVRAAYAAVEQGMRVRDPEVVATYQRAMQSMDPYGEVVRWHQQRTVYSQIGSDPNAWFEKRQEELLKDPAYQAKLMQRIQQSTQPQRQNNLVQLPPSLNRVAAAQGVTDDDNDVSDAALYRAATR